MSSLLKLLQKWPSTHSCKFANARTVNQKKYGWGQTTPREIAMVLALIRDGKMISEAAAEALSEIPPYVKVASKSGAVNASRSEVVLVNAPHGDYMDSQQRRFCTYPKIK